jgi:NAD(P)-dependent dehydrogenase (short-subunit alcohol dehydrogenase family)
VNVTSSVTLARMPLAAAYTASKAAIEGFTGSLAFELEAFNVKVKFVEPGYGPTTRFTSNGALRMQRLIPEAYAPFAGTDLRSIRATERGYNPVRCGRHGVACCERYDGTIPIPSGCRCASAGSVEIDATESTAPPR